MKPGYSYTRCPVCGRKLLITHTDYASYQTLCEEELRCVCGYGESFLYGQTYQWYGPLVPRSDWQDRLYCWLWKAWTFEGCITVEAA